MTWDPFGGIPFDQEAKREIFEELEKDYISGITFTGGDPLHECNRREIQELAVEIKEKYPEYLWNMWTSWWTVNLRKKKGMLNSYGREVKIRGLLM